MFHYDFIINYGFLCMSRHCWSWNVNNISAAIWYWKITKSKSTSLNRCCSAAEGFILLLTSLSFPNNPWKQWKTRLRLDPTHRKNSWSWKSEPGTPLEVWNHMEGIICRHRFALFIALSRDLASFYIMTFFLSFFHQGGCKLQTSF